jgi:hypothetical protein
MAFSAASVTSRFMSILLGDSRLGALQAFGAIQNGEPCKRRQFCIIVREKGK